MLERGAPWLALLALAAALSLQDIRSRDYWWHLRTGALIAETGSVPRADPYTYSVPGARWIDLPWLFQLGLHHLHARGGTAAVVAAKLPAVLLLLVLLARIGYRRERPGATPALLALVLLALEPRLMPRPELSSFALLAAALALLDRFERRGDAWLYALVPLQLLWVNVHGFFTLGLVACGLTAVAELLRPLGGRGRGVRRARLRRLLAVTLLSLGASLANPNGLEGALFPLRQLGMIAPGEAPPLVGELERTLHAGSPIRPQVFAAFLALALLSLAAQIANARRLRPQDPLLWGAFLFLALGANRNLALFAIVSAPIALRNANEWLDARPLPRRPRPRARAAASVLLALALLGLALDATRDPLRAWLPWARRPGLGVAPGSVPAGAAAWIAHAGPPGPIFHSLGDGGYLIWRLHPRYRVLVDGRLEVFGERLRELHATTPRHFRALDRVYRFGVALVRYGRAGRGALLAELHASPEWRLVFVDEDAAVLARAPAPTVDGATDAPAALDLDAPGLFPPLPEQHGAGDLRRRVARAKLLAALGRRERAVALLADALRRYPQHGLRPRAGGRGAREAPQRRARAQLESAVALLLGSALCLGALLEQRRSGTKGVSSGGRDAAPTRRPPAGFPRAAARRSGAGRER